MGRYFHSEVDINGPWFQGFSACWQCCPNPYSAHMLTRTSCTGSCPATGCCHGDC
ncbi:hypothetical protein CgunFtcFv8_005964 [Champsocephalus gunnari]|uniref:Uncharacterized protein n=1 Tax=Champsocephalus gunnari TaxID=52237 RepID=A0AAN8BXF7_CHAGU|nr:hypothetical protein CgunFtcFv8_005964 [Champsocephalus gunnari]